MLGRCSGVKEEAEGAVDVVDVVLNEVVEVHLDVVQDRVVAVDAVEDEAHNIAFKTRGIQKRDSLM